MVIAQPIVNVCVIVLGNLELQFLVYTFGHSHNSPQLLRRDVVFLQVLFAL